MIGDSGCSYIAIWSLGALRCMAAVVEGERENEHISMGEKLIIYYAHTHTRRTKYATQERSKKGEYKMLSPTYLSNPTMMLEQFHLHDNVTFRKRCTSYMRSYFDQPS